MHNLIEVLTTQEACGIRTFSLLEKAIGVIGLRGLDRLLAFRSVHCLNSFLKFYSKEVHPFRTLLDQVGLVLSLLLLLLLYLLYLLLLLLYLLYLLLQ